MPKNLHHKTKNNKNKNTTQLFTPPLLERGGWVGLALLWHSHIKRNVLVEKDIKSFAACPDGNRD
jgi:hypothetical protein